MDAAETVKFAGSQVRFELRARKPGLTALCLVYRGQIMKRLDLPGDPPALAATFREQCARPVDVMTLATKMAT